MDAGTYAELPVQTYSFMTPAIDAYSLEPPEEIITDRQVLASSDFGYNAADVFEGVQGEVKQYFDAGFDINPYDETANDKLGFSFEVDVPKNQLKKGNVVYQFVTYTKTGDFKTKPTTVGCAVTVGSSYLSKIDTFNGTSSMKSDSSAVVNKTWDKQNTKEIARKSESFELVDDLEWYSQYDSVSITENAVQPCLAVKDLGGKLQSNDTIFGQYNITIGARIYANSTDTAPKSLPSQDLQIDFTMP